MNLESNFLSCLWTIFEIKQGKQAVLTLLQFMRCIFLNDTHFSCLLVWLSRLAASISASVVHVDYLQLVNTNVGYFWRDSIVITLINIDFEQHLILFTLFIENIDSIPSRYCFFNVQNCFKHSMITPRVPRLGKIYLTVLEALSFSIGRNTLKVFKTTVDEESKPRSKATTRLHKKHSLIFAQHITTYRTRQEQLAIMERLLLRYTTDKNLTNW